ncbi:MAG: DUF6206 family protein [Myxococcaceae bacterium]
MRRALETGDEGGLRVLGYGEISTVVALETPGGTFACKRLPPFPDASALEAYRRCLDDYLAQLAASGLELVPTTLETLPLEDGRVTGWCVQPILRAEQLLPRHLAACSEEEALRVFEQVVERIERCVTPRLGLDGQLSNWALVDGRPRYLDVTTPLLRDEGGRDRLEVGLFLASLPWLLRGLVRRFMLGGILGKYFVPRGVVVDLLANLLKERLGHLLPVFLRRTEGRFTPPIGEPEVRAYYADDARTWALLLWARRMDRWWQRKVRRRVYPFLLPGPVERHG